MIIFLVFMTVLATAYADCDACIQGICHSKKTLIEGFNITGHQLAIDRANNIVYVHINFQTIAFFLDEAKMRKVDSERTVGLAVDQNTQMLYSGRFVDYSALYTYKYEDGGYTKLTLLDIGRPTPPAKLRHEANTLYIINADGTSAFLDRTSNSITGYHNLENFPVTDMVTVMNESAWFFTADNQLYRYNWDANGNKVYYLVSDKKHNLSMGKFGDVYFVDVNEKVIYKLDREMNIIKYGAYTNASIEDFVFDREENIVFLDYDGYVAHWVPTEKPCTDFDFNFDFSVTQNKRFRVVLVQGPG